MFEQRRQVTKLTFEVVADDLLTDDRIVELADLFLASVGSEPEVSWALLSGAELVEYGGEFTSKDDSSIEEEFEF